MASAGEQFQKGNRPRTVTADHAVYYAQSAIAITTSIAANVIDTLTITVPFQFKGCAQLLATLPPGDALDTGLSIGSCILEAPASGSYAAGNHPTVKVQIINNTTAAVTTAAAHDLVIVEY